MSLGRLRSDHEKRNALAELGAIVLIMITCCPVFFYLVKYAAGFAKTFGSEWQIAMESRPLALQMDPESEEAKFIEGDWDQAVKRNSA